MPSLSSAEAEEDKTGGGGNTVARLAGGDGRHGGVVVVVPTEHRGDGTASIWSWCCARTVENHESFCWRRTRDGLGPRTGGHNGPCTIVGNCTRPIVSERISPACV